MFISVRAHLEDQPVEFESSQFGDLGALAQAAWEIMTKDWNTWLDWASSDNNQIGVALLEAHPDSPANATVLALAAFNEIKTINPPLAILMLAHGFASATMAGPEKKAMNRLVIQPFTQGLIVTNHLPESFPFTTKIFQAASREVNR
ncbi:MAG: hypothetical protein V1487_03730 [bacterium]